MKPLVLAVFSALAFSPGTLRAAPAPGDEAATGLQELKQRYKSGGQKPDAARDVPSQPGQGVPVAEPTLAEIEALLLKSPGCKKNPDDTAKLAENLKDQFSLVSCNDPIDGLRQIVLVPKSVSPGRQLVYGSVPGHKLQRARLVDHYLVLQFDTQTQHLDLLKQDKDASGRDIGFAFVRPERNGREQDLNIDYANVGGAANAVSAAVSSADEALPNEILLPESRRAKATAARNRADAVLYESEDAGGKKEEKKHFLMFKYRALEPKDPSNPDGPKEEKIFRVKAIEVFNAANPFPGGPVQIQGLTGAAVVRNPVAVGYRFLSGSTKDRGVMAVFQNKQLTGDRRKDKAGNCVGPVVWWGLPDHEAAMKACQDEKL